VAGQLSYDSGKGAHHAMSFSETISPFFGRCAFVWVYLTSAMDILGGGGGKRR
jgi:hypothetical protein